MCHLLLFMPVIGLPLFWLVPLNFAIPIYIAIVLVSGLLYWLIMRSMRSIPVSGAESLLGSEAEVVSRSSAGHIAQYLVRSQGELWSARSAYSLQAGETVRVAAVNGASLVVERGDCGSHPDRPSDAGRGCGGAMPDERHCHKHFRRTAARK